MSLYSIYAPLPAFTSLYSRYEPLRAFTSLYGPLRDSFVLTLARGVRKPKT